MTVNGKEHQWQQGLTLLALLEQQALDPVRVAALINGAVAPKDRFGEMLLQRDDAVELVSFVGGG